jgi:hypothetical protein
METEELLNLVEILLREEDDFIVPTAKLLELILAEKENWPLELEDLCGQIASDPRFKLFESASTQELWDEEMDDPMRALGHYRGPRVMLIERVPSEEEFQQVLTEKMQRTLETLKTAYRVLPENLEDSQNEEVWQIKRKVAELTRKLGDVFTNKKE